MAALVNDYDNFYPAGTFPNTYVVDDVAAVAGNYMVVLINHENAGGDASFSPPTWNGETIAQIFPAISSFTAAESGNEDIFSKASFFGAFLTTSATADVSATMDGFRDGYIWVGVFSGVNTGTPLSALFKQQVFSTWSAPSLSATGVASGDVIISMLNASFWDNGYSTHPATTWTQNGGQTLLSNLSISSNRIGRFLVSSKTGTGSVNVGYTPSAAQPVFSQIAFVLKDAASTSIDTLTTDGNSGLVVGEPFAMTTTGLGTITSITVTTAATPAATTSAINLALPSGDGTGEMKYWVDTEYFPFEGTVTVVASDGTLTATGTFPLALPADQVDVIFNTVETTDNTYLGNALLAAGHPLANGDIGYYPSGIGLTIGTNSHISSLDGAIVFTLWIHKTSGILEEYTVTINDAGEITDVTGITSRGITSRGITSRNITSRGLS